MSFRENDARRYGHVPPVQYPIAENNDVGRRSSFNSGDDGAYYGQQQQQQQQPVRLPAFGIATRGMGEDELFMTSPGRQPSFPSANNAMSGYRHQYQGDIAPSTPAQTYNPQSFAQTSPTGFQRSQTVTSMPYGHDARYAATTPPTNFTPQAYNPAAYASATSPQRQPTYHGHGGVDQGYGTAGLQRGPSQYMGHGQSPGITHSPSFSQQNHAAAYGGYRQSMVSPSIGATSPNTQMQTPTYDPSQYASNQYPPQNLNGANPSSAYSQAPYPTTSQIPAGPQYSADRTSMYRDTRSNSQTSPLASPPVITQSLPGIQRHPTNAPLPSRPFDNAPNTPRWNAGFSDDSEQRTQESIMQDIEAELGSIGISQRTQAPSINGQYGVNNSNQLNRYNSNATTLTHSTSRASSNLPKPTSAFDDDDDDPEGTAGVLAMQQAELDDRRFSGSTFTYGETPGVPSNTLPPPPEEQSHSSDSDFGGMFDLGALSGGYAGTLTYGDDVGSPPTAGPEQHQQGTQPLASPSYFNQDATAYEEAKMDYGDTGGLQPPTIQRQSFDDGDERLSLNSSKSGTELASKGDYQDLFYHPGQGTRPLPALPPQNTGSESSSMLSVTTADSGLRGHQHSVSYDGRYYQPNDPESFYQSGSTHSPQPERSISLAGHSHTPQVQAPARSRTDATEERKKNNRQHQVLTTSGPFSEYEGGSPASIGAFDGITLPSGRKRKFVPSKLAAGDFNRCTEPWAFSGIEAWVREMADGEMDLKTKVVEEALVFLFTHKVPTMNVADAELLSSRAVSLMLGTNVLVPDEEWVKFGNGHISGVMWQMTGSGCYSSKAHDPETGGRCYSYHCTRTLKKVELDEFDPELAKPTDEWHVFYRLKKEDWESKPKKEVDRQNILHEIVTGEENYMKQLDIFRTLYRDDLRSRNPPILHPERQDKFLIAVFGKLDTVLRVNKENLLSQLKYRQQEQGPWITGFSDIFREWIRKAKSDYIEYAAGYPRAQYMVRREADRNVYFRKFLEEKRQHKSSLKQDWTHFLITPLQRLQRYILLLESIDGKMPVENEEKINLQKAIQEVKTVTLECDAKVEETNKRVQMMELDRMLVLRPGFQSILNLDHLGRQLIMEGELQRMGSKGVRWVDSHALLFDHYLILAKVVFSRDRGEKKYDVSKEPIPMPLLFLESMSDEPVTRQKGITTPLTRTTTAGPGGQLSKVSSNGGGRPMLEHSATGSSMASSHLTPTGSNDAESKILYPFRIKHLGHEVYTLYAQSSRDRMEWCNRIIEAKTNHAKALFSQNAEPFRLRVLADASFSYDTTSMYSRTAGVPVKGTPLDRAIEDLEGVLGSAQGIPPVCRAQVNCATGFTAFNKSIIAIGTDYGVFIADPSNPRGWTRTVQTARVTQIAVLEEFSICLIIADRSLISYPLDVIAPVSEFAPPVSDNPRRAPQRLAKDVGYFATSKMKDRMLVFYKRKEGLHTMFKVLEPIYHKATEKKSRLFGGGKKNAPGSTETFRDFDEFFFPTECYSLSLFQTYIAVSTSKGIEMLTLDKKQPLSIPDLKAPAIANIASRIRDQRPLGMFRLNDNEFILTYEDCAVYVDKHGDVSRTLIMEYTGKQKKARGATMYGQYLLLFNEDYVEVRNAENGRLRQIIAGRDVRALDYGVRGPTGGNPTTAQWQQVQPNGQAPTSEASKGSVKIVMCHPELQGRQIVLEMLLNDGHTET